MRQGRIVLGHDLVGDLVLLLYRTHEHVRRLDQHAGIEERIERRGDGYPPPGIEARCDERICNSGPDDLDTDRFAGNDDSHRDRVPDDNVHAIGEEGGRRGCHDIRRAGRYFGLREQRCDSVRTCLDVTGIAVDDDGDTFLGPCESGNAHYDGEECYECYEYNECLVGPEESCRACRRFSHTALFQLI